MNRSDVMLDPYIRHLLVTPPILYMPTAFGFVMSGEEIWAETMDLIYCVEEQPAAISRMVGEGCPNCVEVT